MNPGKALVAAVRQKLYDEYGPFWERPGGLPDGLRLELHPLAANWLMTDPELLFDYRASDPRTHSGQAAVIGVPVKVTGPDLEPGQWRLVIVTEKVLLGGRLGTAAGEMK